MASANNVIKLAHLALMLYVDDNSSDRFLTHINTCMPPAINLQETLVGELLQIEWSNSYWIDQLSYANVVCPLGLISNLSCDNLIDYDKRFNTYMMPLITEHRLPVNITSPIQPLG